MADGTDWPEIESEVHIPGSWLVLLVGGTFTVAGLLGIVLSDRFPQPNVPFWIAASFCGVFVAFGMTALILTADGRIRTVRIRHAAPEVLPDVPREPVLREGSVVSGRLTHELVESPAGWEFRPNPAIHRGDRRFLLGFGIPFSVLFIGLLSWAWQGGPIGGWPMAIGAATFVTLLCGGSAFGLVGLVLTSRYRSLGRLEIPRGGGDLEVDLAKPPESAVQDPAAGLKEMFLGGGERERSRVPADRVVAVQLCPWRLRVRNSTTWGVQGTLVVSPGEGTPCERVPILLTGDFTGAARLMETLAETLHVPYLFGADAEGWKAEEIRAKSRPPLSSGGHVT